MRRSPRSTRRAAISMRRCGAADHDPRELERIEERLFALRAAGAQIQRAGRRAQRARRALCRRSRPDRCRRRAARRAGSRGARGRGAIARPPRAVGQRAARRPPKLDKAVNRELKPLKLERAHSRPRSRPIRGGGPHGIDRVEFWVQTNPGHAAGPADEGRLRAASSRASCWRSRWCWPIAARRRRWCSTRSIPASAARSPTPSACGWRGSAGRVQVMAVTHAPQVAARADRHYLISKSALDKGKRVATRVAEVAAERRREEIARMLAGAEITDEARAAAERLIKAAGRDRPAAADHAALCCGAQREFPDDARTNDRGWRKRRRQQGSRRRAHRGAGRSRARTPRSRDRRARPALLPGRRADGLGSPNTTRCASATRRSRRAFPRLMRAELALAPGRAPSRREVRQGAPRRADALARQRVHDEDVADFVDRIRRFLRLPADEPIAFTAEPKIDGLSLSLRYEGGRLVRARRAATAREGEDVTANVRRSKTSRSSCAGRGSRRLREVRGEVYMTKSAFSRSTSARRRRAAGLRQSAQLGGRLAAPARSAITASRPLGFFAYSWGEMSEMPAPRSPAW